MNRRLQFALVATLAMSALALWPRKTPPLVGVADLAVRQGEPVQPASQAQRLPATIERWPIDMTTVRGDPFALPAPAAPPPQPASVTMPVTIVAPATPPPTAPAVQYRYFGRLTSPDGRQDTLLARGDTVVVVSDGMPLDDGYVVQGVLAEAVRLLYPALGTVVDIPVPPPPSLPR